MIKVIIMDVDGTLVTSNGEISEITKKALITAQVHGIKVILASGRPTSGMQPLIKALKLDQYGGYIVSYNGACVIDCATNEILYQKTMSVESSKAVLQYLKQFEITPMIDKDDYMYVTDVFNNMITYNNKPFNVLQYESRGGFYKLCEVDDLVEFVDFTIHKILTYGEPSYIEANYQKMMEPFKESLHCVRTSAFYFEYTAKGIDKASALDCVITPLGYKPDEMMAFGDGHNDASMLKYVGLPIAMGNAVDELKAFCYDTTKSNDEDGIVYALKKYLPEIF